MQQTTLFESTWERPLASRMRPRDLDEFAGQQHLWGPARSCASSSRPTGSAA